MDEKRTEISDRDNMVVIHGTGRKIMKVKAYSSQFWAKFSSLGSVFPFQIKDKCHLFGFRDSFIVNLV